ncbi:MAG: hypothetical protein ACRDRL_00335 [Sciscionella sp.]
MSYPPVVTLSDRAAGHPACPVTLCASPLAVTVGSRVLVALRHLAGMAVGCAVVLTGWLAVVHPGPLVFAAALFVAAMVLVYVLMGTLGRLVRPRDSRRRAQIVLEARTVRPVRSHRPVAGRPGALTSGPRVIRGEVER